MYEVKCLDFDGNTIANFFQWDVDQSIVINVKGRDEDYLAIAPEVHFANRKSKEAYVVRSTDRIDVTTLPTMSENADKGVIYVKDGKAYIWNGIECVPISDMALDMDNTIVANVPNALLQEPYPLLVYVYLTDGSDVSSQRTVLYSEIPVRKRAKPSDYEYVENITRVTAEMIKDEIEASVSDTRSDAIADVTNTRNAAVTTITNVKTDAEQSIAAKKAEFIDIGNSLVAEANGIVDDTDQLYEQALAKVSSLNTTIQNNVNTLIHQRGVKLKTTDDSLGNVTLSIVIPTS